MTSSTNRPHFGLKPSASARGGDRLEPLARRFPVLGTPVVKRRRQRLQLQVGPAGAARERVDPLGGRRCGRLQLEPVLTDVAEPVDADDLARERAGATRHTGDETIGAREPFELRSRLVRDARILGPLDDRREHAVDVEKQSCPRGFAGERSKRVHAAILADSAEIGNTCRAR